MEDDFMENKKPLVKRHVLKSEIRRVDLHELKGPEVEASDHSSIKSDQRNETGFMNNYDYDVEDRTVKQIIALGCDVSVSKKVVTDTLDRIEKLGQHPNQPGRTARIEIFYFIGHVMQSHSKQKMIQQASNPFKNPRHMSVIITRLLEIYLASNPSVRFLIITYPMHHLTLMLALRDHIGSDVLKVVTIMPAPPFSQRTTSLSLGGEEDFTYGRKSPDVFEEAKSPGPFSNPFFTPEEPKDPGKPDFVLYTTSPFDTVERIPIRIDLLIREIEEFVNPPPEESSPVMVPRPAVAWDPEPTGLPHPLSNVTRAGSSTPLEPINLEAAARFKTSNLMAKYQHKRLELYPNAPPRNPEVVSAQWDHTYKKVYNAFRKIKLGKGKPVYVGPINPSDDEKADDEGDPEGSGDESDDSSITSINITPVKEDTSFTMVNKNPFDSGPESDNESVGTIQHHPVHSDNELNSANEPNSADELDSDDGRNSFDRPSSSDRPNYSDRPNSSDQPNSADEFDPADGSTPRRSLKKRLSFSPLSMSYSFERSPGDRSSGFWGKYANDQL